MSKSKKEKKSTVKTQKEKPYYTSWSGERFTKKDNITDDFLIEMTNGKGDDEPNE